MGTGTITGVLRDIRTGAPAPGLSCHHSSRAVAGGAMILDGVLSDALGVFELQVPAGQDLTVWCGSPRGELVIGEKDVVVRVERGGRARFELRVLRVGRDAWGGELGAAFRLDGGSLVVDTVENGALGLRAGDVVRSIDGIAAAGLSIGMVHSLILDRADGRPARVVVVRDGVERAIDVTP
jgi:hypothetical protein